MLLSAQVYPMNEPDFISRKIDHLRVALLPESRSSLGTGLERIRLEHDSMPELDLEQVNLSCEVFGIPVATPFFIAGMTAGHPGADELNLLLARCAARRGWVMGIGSQRRELNAAFSDGIAASLKTRFPDLILISNLGIAQLIEIERSGRWDDLDALLVRTGSNALAIHLNPLQECIQVEGTPRFRGAFSALALLCERIRVPVLIKETGSGMSSSFLKRIRELPLAGVDVSGLGGTHWGRVEGLRSGADSPSREWGEVFGNWGITTSESVLNAVETFRGTSRFVWASGGIRTGLDAGKCLALGAHRVGFAGAILEAAGQGETFLLNWMERREQELRIAMFCTNSGRIEDLRNGKKWSRE